MIVETLTGGERTTKNLSEINSVSILGARGDANKVALINNKEILLTLSCFYQNHEEYLKKVSEFFHGTNFFKFYDTFFVNLENILKINYSLSNNYKNLDVLIIFKDQSKKHLKLKNSKKDRENLKKLLIAHNASCKNNTEKLN